MKKLLITAATALSLLLPCISSADIIFYKNGKVKHDVKSQEITLKLCSVSDDVSKLDRDSILGIQGYDNGKLDISLKNDSDFNWDMGHSTTGDCLKIVIKDSEGKEEIINGEEIEKYLFTNDVVPDKEIIKKYEFIKVASQYYKKIGLTPGESFSLYRDDVKESYVLVSIDNLKLATNYQNMQLHHSFDKEEINSLEQKLKLEGKDTYVAVVASAGCSLTPSFVTYPNSRFADPIFHEWWHENKTDLPLELNEAVATAVGLACAEDFLSKHLEYKNSLRWDEELKTSKAYSRYSKMIVEYYEKLEKIYNSEMPDEQKLKAKEQILEEMEQKTWHKMSNAELSFAITYCRYFNLVDKVTKHYPNIEDAVKVLKEIPGNSIKEGVKYLEDLLKVEVQKPKIETYY
ncbi:MAG: aminopeptidase [Nanoarchaeota archaeon]|nr:aminopeptidase [Nanoarchaeota archaeon]